MNSGVKHGCYWARPKKYSKMSPGVKHGGCYWATRFKKYGFYSILAVHKVGEFIYIHAETGQEIAVTCIDSDPKAPSYIWPDKVCAGPVTEYVGRRFFPDTYMKTS